MSEAYRLEVDAKGCEHCSGKRSWTIVGPDGVAIGTSWEDEEFASDIADLMNMAHDAALETTRPEVACSGETPRTDALIASKPGLWREWKDSDFHALSQHAGQMERLAKRWQKIADQRAIEVADLKTSVPSPLRRIKPENNCMAMGAFGSDKRCKFPDCKCPPDDECEPQYDGDKNVG